MAEAVTPPPGPVFILAPPLGLGAHLAACLGRHPGFEALPAVHLFAAESLNDLARRWGGRLAGHDHGIIRAVAGLLCGGDADRAADWLAARGTVPPEDILAELAATARPCRLVDPSFLYPLDDRDEAGVAAVGRIAATVPGARFIHLLRHPARMLPDPAMAAARAGALWLAPHLRVDAALADLPPLSWLRLRAEWLAADPAPRLAALLDWLGAKGDAGTIARMCDAAAGAPPVGPAPARTPHGVDPALAADPALSLLLGGAADPGLDDAGWEAAGFDAETRAMARLFGYT
jgi:hypothetical protein